MKKLKLIFATFALLLGVSNAWAGQTPENDGVYYLYNTETGKFLCRGNNWGTQAVTNDFGQPWKVTVADGNFILRMYDLVTDGSTSGLGDNGFADNGSPIAFTPSGDANGYKLVNGSNYLTSPATYGNSVLATDENGNTTWQFLNTTEYAEILASKISTQEAAVATSASVDISGTTLGAVVTDASKWAAKDLSSSVPAINKTNWPVTSIPSRAGNVNAGTYGLEIYQGGGTFTNTLSGLAKGIYKVGIKAMYRGVNNAKCYTVGQTGYTNSSAYLSANGNMVQIKDWYSSCANENKPNSTGEFTEIANNGGYYSEVYCYVGDAGTLEIKAVSESYWGGSWFLFGGITLTYYTDQVSEAEANAIISQAEALESEIMNSDISSALTTAKETFESSKTIANYNTLGTAITNATNSKTAYASANEYFTEAEDILANTNVYTSEAYATYYTEPKAKYEARTLTTDEANALVKTSTVYKSANTIDDILLSSWKIGGEQCKDYDKSLYINTWSTEGATDGSEFLAPFFEYWVADASSLGANTLTSTVTGLTANSKYSVSVRARVRQTNGQTKIANGITMQVGSGDAVDISAGTQFGTGQFYIGNFSAVGETDAEGNLVTTITVADASNISWLSFYNVKYQDMSSLVAAFTAKQTEATELLANATYTNVTGSERTALTDAKNATPSTFDEYNSAITALQNAIDAFKAAVTNYDALVAEIAHAKSLGVAEETANSYAATSETTSATAATNVQALNVEEYNYVTTNFTGTVTLGSWTNAPGTNKGQSWNGTADDTYYDLYNSAARSMTQSITLPTGDYILYAKGRSSAGGSLTMSDGTTTVQFPAKGDTGKGIATDGAANFGDGTFAYDGVGRGWEYRFIKITSDGSAKTLTFVWTTASSNWAGLDDIVLCGTAATADEKTALANAITAAEAYTLGFENGEYAPYNNISALEALAAAKAIDPETASGKDVVAATTALTGATWTANTEEVNAIYDGYFASEYSHEGNVMPVGWHGVGDKDNATNVRLMWNVSSNAGLAAATNSQAAFGKFTILYGTETGYTMPLKAGNYSLKFIFGGWNEVATRDIKIYKADDAETEATVSTVTITAKDNKAHTTVDSWSSYDGIFSVPSDGNYVISFYRESTSAQNQICISDIEIMSAPSSVSYTVPSKGIGTLASAYALDFSGVEGLEAYVVSETTASAATCTQITEAPAGTGVVLVGTPNTEYTIPVVVSADAPASNLLVGCVAATDIAANEAYILQEGAFHLVTAASTVPAGKAYLSASEVTARSLTLNFGGDVTGVNAVEAASEAELADGKYLENGKVVIVKNGKKYNATGAQIK